MKRIIRWGHNMNADLSGFNNLIRVSVPIYALSGNQGLLIDHIYYRKEFREIIIHAEMVEDFKEPYTPTLPPLLAEKFRELK